MIKCSIILSNNHIFIFPLYDLVKLWEKDFIVLSILKTINSMKNVSLVFQIYGKLTFPPRGLDSDQRGQVYIKFDEAYFNSPSLIIGKEPIGKSPSI